MISVEEIFPERKAAINCSMVKPVISFSIVLGNLSQFGAFAIKTAPEKVVFSSSVTPDLTWPRKRLSLYALNQLVEVEVMYAVIRTGGKQYRVNPGEIIRVEKLPGEVGAEISFDDVLMVGGEGEPVIGTPAIKDAKVRAKIVMQDKARKILVFKYKKRTGYRNKRGHRQPFTGVAIQSIDIGAEKKRAEG